MGETKVRIEIYSDEHYEDLIEEASCRVDCELGCDGRTSYGYDWDVIIAHAIKNSVDHNDWNRAITSGCDGSLVNVFYNTEGGPELIWDRSKAPFTPFVFLSGRHSVENLDQRFSGKKIISKSVDQIDNIFRKIPDHPDSIALLFSEILKLRKESFGHFDVVYKPEIRSLQMLQWLDEYSHMFYFTTQDEISKFRKIRWRFGELDKVERSLTNFLDDMNESDQAHVKDFLIKMEGFKEDTWQRLLGMSLARTMLEAE